MLTVIKCHVIKRPQIFSSLCSKPQKYFPTIPTKLTIVKNTESTAVKRIVVFFFIFNCSEKIMGRGVIFGRREGDGGEYINHKAE